MKNPEKSIKKISLTFMFVVFLFSSALSQIRILVETDLEGVSGVYNFDQSRTKDTPLNIQACEYFMKDLAALVRGLRAGGADEIIVVDSHGSQALLPHMMVPGAKYVTGKPKTIKDGWALDSTFAGVVMFGYHAMMGTPDGVLCHTQSSLTEHRYWYNGIETGELGQTAILAGFDNVPPIMVTGDVATCREATNFFGPEVVTVATKQGISREAAILYPFEETSKAIYNGAKKAVKAIPRCNPYKVDLPLKCKVEYLNLEMKPKPELITKEWVSEDGRKIYGP